MSWPQVKVGDPEGKGAAFGVQTLQRTPSPEPRFTPL
jgi:hypothetical protein